MIHKSVFDMIDDEAAKTGNTGNYLLFIAKCAGVNSREDLGLLSGLKTLACQRNAPQEDVSRDISRIGDIQELLTDYYAGILDLRVFDKCTSSQQLFDVVSELRKCGYGASPVSGALPSNWIQQSLAEEQNENTAVPCVGFYKDGVLRFVAGGVNVASDGGKFKYLGCSQDYELLISNTEDDLDKRCLHSIPLLTPTIFPLLIGVYKSIGDSVRVTVGGSSTKISVVPAAPLRKGLRGDAAELFDKAGMKDMRYGTKVVTDKVSGLPIRIVVVGY